MKYKSTKKTGHICLEFSEIALSQSWKINYPETEYIKVTSAKTFIVGDTLTHSEFLHANYDDSDWSYINIVGNMMVGE